MISLLLREDKIGEQIYCKVGEGQQTGNINPSSAKKLSLELRTNLSFIEIIFKDKMQIANLGLTLVIITTLLRECPAANAPLTIGPSIKYSYSGVRVFDTSGYYSSGPSTVSGLLYSIPFTYAMNDTAYKSTIALQEIYAELNNRQFNLYFRLDSKQQSALNFLIYSNMMNKIQTMTFRYLVVASNWGTFSGYWHIYTVSPGQIITISSPYIDTITGLSSVNFSSNIRVFAVLTGFDIVASSSANELSLLIDVTRISSTQSELVLSTYSSSGITLNAVSYSQLAIDVNQINAIPGRVHIGTFNASSGGTIRYLDTANIAMSYNTIFGLRGFHITNQSFLSWNLTINPGVSIDGTSSNAFLFFNFIYLILQESWCPYPIPYLLIANSTCYDLCPERYYSRQLSWTCEPCLYDCYICTGPTNCTECNQTTDYRVMDNATNRCVPIEGYYDDGTNNSTALPCVDPCLTCSSASNCLSCNLTFYLSGGACLPCAPNCQNCTSNTSCIECFAPYDAVAGSCVLNCTAFVSNCFNCEVVPNTVDVNCTQCQLGFFLDTSTNNCSIICGDGILASTESCDDGNLINGDGCDSACAIETAFYCEGTVGNTSNCSSCSDHCLNCTSQTNCTLCQVLYIVNASWCMANCSEVEYCVSCSVTFSGGGDFVQCSVCSGGYSVDPSLNECKPICGDGLVAPEEECDDANLNAGDGCSSTCQVETYFVCNQSLTSNSSECFLTTLSLQLVGIAKDSGRNSGVMHFKPTPAGLPLFQSLNWAELLVIDSNSIDVTSVTYDPATGEVVANFNYNTTIDSQSLTISLNTTRDNTLSKVTNSSVVVKATASNNQALVYYTDDNYQLANVVKYLALACSACALLFLLIGVVTGRLIGLECAALIQLTFISLLTLQNISPSFSSLSFLCYSLGYNKIKNYDLGEEIDRPLKGIEISHSFLYNYNLMSVFILLALLSGVIFKVIATATSKQKMGVWLRRSKLAAGEYTLYFFLFFAYLAYLSLLVEFKYRSGSQDMIYLISIGMGALTVVLGIVYAFIYSCGQSCFSEFKDKFQQGFGKKYYIFPIIERLASPALIVLFLANYTANITVIVLSVLLAVVILKGQPYKGHRKNWRPLTNYLLAIVIQLIFLVVGMMGDPASMLALYGPLLVVFLLLICIIYSVYALVKQFRQYLESSCKQEELSEGENEEAKMREFAETLMRESNVSIIRKSSYCQEGEQHGKECGSPSRLQVLTIRDRLQSLKMTHRSDREQLLDKSANQGNIIDIPSQISDSI